MVVNVYVSAVTTDNVSRHELVAWVNTILQSQLTKIEEMATGAAYCQLTHCLFPENISLRKIKWNSKNEMDHINNWKILGVAWKDIGIDKPVQVDRLVKAKFQDNYEFLQWFYKFFNTNVTDDVENYDALGHRGGEALPIGAKGPARAVVSRAPPARPVATRATAPVKKAPAAAAAVKPTPAPAATAASSAADKARIQELETMIADREDALQTAEREREFYFNKLRQVEDLCNTLAEDEKPDKEKILAILYSTDEEGAAVADDVIDPTEDVAAVEANLDDSETF